jgi:hypothetical protein
MLVIGGVAGLAAAIQAHDLGAVAAIAETLERPGENTASAPLDSGQ